MTLLSLFTLGTTTLGWFYSKPARYQQTKRGRFDFSFMVVVTLYCRAFIVYSLPLVIHFVHVPLFRWLILRSYATSAHLGRECWIAMGMPDPDLTFVGANVVIGDSCRLIAHSITRTPDGLVIFQSAPIELGDGCVIGGGAQIELGTKIGARSLVEPCSRVLPFTIIPAGEVWGGTPAVFIRQRNPAATTTEKSAKPAATEHKLEETCALVARALSLPIDEVNGETTSSNCLAWDSLGKMGIGAALFDRFGFKLTPEETFALDSIADVQRAIAKGDRSVGAKELEVQLPSNPELLPLLDTAKAVAALSRPTSQTNSPASTKTRVVIAATFVAQPVASALELFSRAFGMAAEIEFFDFNQVQQALLSAESAFHKNPNGLNVVLVRPEDLRGANGAERQAVAEQLFSAIRQFVATTGEALAVSDLPPQVSTFEPGNRMALDELRIWWRRQLERIKGVEIVGFAEIIDEIGLIAAHDARMELEASAPYTPQVYQRLGVAIARAVRKRHVTPRKVLALDCDGTLWGGVVGEDGVEGLQLGAEGPGRGFRALQERILEFKKRGVLLVIVSKNLAEDVWKVIENHPGMVLRRKDFAGARINWKPKSENLRELAAELNLGLDAFVLLDDNPAERLEVEAACPQVTVVPLPAEAARFSETLAKLWLFDGAGGTTEDAQRNEYVQQDVARKSLQQSTGSLEDYLVSLELRVEMRQAREEDLPRVAQLTQKTNQFNLSLKRRTLQEIRALQPGFDIWVLSASDRFGDYGLVGGCIARVDNGALMVDTLLVSCRALGRGVEDAFLHGIAQRAQSAGAKKLQATYAAGTRNEPIKHFLERGGFLSRENGTYELALTQIPPRPRHLKFEIR